MTMVVTMVGYETFSLFENIAMEISSNKPRIMKASEFKAKCLQLMNEVAESGDEIIITKNGRPVSRLAPYRERPKSLFGIDKGRIEILGDIGEPIDVEWKAVSDPGRVLDP